MSGVTARAVAAFAVLPLAVAPASAAPSVSRRVLENGLTVLVSENPAAPVVAVSLQMRAGSRFETPERAGITNLLLRTMVRGAGKRSALQLAEAAEELGGSLEASGEVETAELRGRALARHWGALLDLVAEVALHPTLAAEEIERERRLVLSQIQTRADTPLPLSLDNMLRDLYSGHPYGWHSLGTRESVERLGRPALLAHHGEVFRPEHVVLAVSGQAPRERVVKVVERLFARLPRSGTETAEPPPVAAPRGGRRVLERPAQQAQVLVGYLGPGLGDPDYPAARVLGAVLGGGMAGRLFVELRDKRGLAYSLGALTAYRTGPAFLVAYLGTARQNAAAAEAAVLEELERIRSMPVSVEELARAKAYVLGNLALDRRTNARQAWYLAFFEAVGAGWAFPERYAKALEAVTPADVAAAAQRYLVRPTIVVLVPPER
jgi:predicted Zn-dependent peptidase